MSRRTAVRLAAVVAAAGCVETAAPTARPTAPDQVTANLSSMVTLVSSPAFSSFRGMGQLIVVTSASGTAPIFPDSLLGRTFAWNTTSHTYASGAQDTVPATGIRFLLYTPDSTTGRPIEPVTQLGQVDLLDASVTDTTRLHIVAGGGSAATLFDYNLRGAFAPDTFVGRVTGCASDAGTDSFCADATVSQRLDQGDTVLSVAGTGQVPGVALTYTTSARFRAAGGVQELVDLTAQAALPAQVIRISGNVEFGTSPSANLAITVNGLAFATIQGTGTVRIRGPNGALLTQDESNLVATLFSLPGWLLDFGRATARPGQQLLS